MICKVCNIHMVPGTSYEKSGSRRYDECPKCHFRKYNKGANIQEPKTKQISKIKHK